MKPEDKIYILEHIGKKPVKEIAKELHLRERKVARFIQYNKANVTKSKPLQETEKHDNKLLITISLILIATLSFVVYINSINGEFLLDDPVFIKDNIFVKSWIHLSKLFLMDMGKGSGSSFNYYRPIQMFAYMVIYNFWQLNVWPYHILSILIHVLVVLSVYWMVNILYEDNILSLYVAILYAVFPAHVETVAYVSALGDLLVGLFTLLTFILYVKQLKTNKLGIYVLLFMSYLMALFSKENSLMLPGLFLLYHITFKKRIKVYPFISLVALTFVYLIFYISVLKGSAATGMKVIEIMQRIPGFLVAIAGYMRILFLPLNLHMGYDSRLFQFNDPKAIIGMFILLLLVFLALKIRRNNDLIFFAIGWFFTALLPVSNLYAVAFYMADHYLYLPSIGFFLILGKGLRSVYDNRKLKIYSLGGIVILTAFYFYLTFKQNSYWKDPLSFFERTARYNPYSFRALNNLGREYEKRNRLDEAKQAYEKAIAANPLHREAYNNLGNVYSKLGKYEEAIAMYKKSIEINPNYAKAYYNLANIKDMFGKSEEAMVLYRKAVEINPNFIEAYLSIGALNSRFGRTEEAIEAYKKAIEINPNLGTGYLNLSLLYFDKKQYDLAIKYCDLATAHGYKVPLELVEGLKAYRK